MDKRISGRSGKRTDRRMTDYIVREERIYKKKGLNFGA
jgi:hypothetical protein